MRAQLNFEIGQDNDKLGGIAAYVGVDGTTAIVYLGLLMDGITTYANISAVNPDIKFRFYTDPSIYCQLSGDIQFKPNVNPTIYFQVCDKGLL